MLRYVCLAMIFMILLMFLLLQISYVTSAFVQSEGDDHVRCLVQGGVGAALDGHGLFQHKFSVASLH